MHKININDNKIRTDLIIDKEISKNNYKIIDKSNNLKVLRNTKNKIHYTTIFYNDITDKDNFKNVEKVFVKELNKYIKKTNNETILIVGLGNNKSTPDSLGPNTIDNVLVTRYLFKEKKIEEGYSNVSAFNPNVMGNTGIETSKIIKSLIKEIKATKVIIVDSLKTNNMNRLGKTIQITDQGIFPGSGINNNRKEISKKTVGCDVIAIGIPTVLDIKSLVSEIDENENYIVTPTNIDFLILKLSLLLSNGLNISLHKNFIRQNNI